MKPFVTLAAAAFFALAAPALSREAVTPAKVKESITKGRAFLLSKQLAGGHWEPDAKRIGVDHNWGKFQGDSWGGYTAVCTYALLAAGEKPQDTKIAAAIEFLKEADMMGIYSIGMRCQVWYLLPQTPQNAGEIKKLLQRDLLLLQKGINTVGPSKGMWDYGDGHGAAGFAKGRIDHSVSQYGVLGMWALEQAGAEVDNRYWQLFDSVWREHQLPEGGWIYDGTPTIPSPEKKPVSASMTAAGVATLFITQDMLHGQEGASCNGNQIDSHIDDGLRWMGQHFDQVNNNYAYYGVERIGVASGYKYFGSVDWYTQGAEKLVGSQKADGSWTSTEPGAGPLQDTAFALLFLSRGSAPVMLNKLDYRQAPGEAPPAGAAGVKAAVAAKAAAAKEKLESPWNQRPRDAANLAKFVGHQTEGFLNWQIVNLAAPVEELHDAPILYISGNRALKFTDADEAKLKLFVQQGGMILGNADCPAEATGGPFAKSFRELGTKLFGAEFRHLEGSHPLFTEEQYRPARWKNKEPGIFGLSNGVRELMILLPQDPARAWQTDAHVSRVEEFEIGADIYQYATDKQNTGFKGETYLVKAAKPAKTTIQVARLESGENSDPEPAGWGRLDAILRNGWEIGLTPTPVKLGQGKLEGFKLAHLTGTTRFKFSDEQRQELKQFIDKGGTLVVDAAGGSNDFATSAERELGALGAILGATSAPGDTAGATTTPAAGPEGAGAVLPRDHAVYARPDAAIADFGYRNFARLRLSGRFNGPRVRGIEKGNRVAIFFSREDLSAGMVGEPVDGILGYDPATATAIMRNIVLYAARPAGAAAQTAPSHTNTAPGAPAREQPHPAKKAGK